MPVYENEQDIENENRIIASVADSKWLEAKKNKKFFPFDYCLCAPPRNGGRGFEIKEFCEVKCRNGIALSQTPEYFISLEKIMKALSLANLAGVPFFLYVEFREGVFGIKIDEKLIEESLVEWVGVTHKRDGSNASEPMLVFHTTAMGKI